MIDKNYFLKLLYLFLALMSIYILSLLINLSFITKYFAVLVIFFAISTMIFHVSFTKATQKTPLKFINYFISQTALRLLLYLSILILYAIFIKDDTKNFLISFLILYIIFTIFEVSVNLKYIKKQKKN